MLLAWKHRVNEAHAVNVPANASHSFKNKSDNPARLFCMCTPSGQEEFFMAVAGCNLSAQNA